MEIMRELTQKMYLIGTNGLVEAAEAGIARHARGDRLIQGRRGELRLGCGVRGDGGGAKTGDGEGDDENTDDVVLHMR